VRETLKNIQANELQAVVQTVRANPHYSGDLASALGYIANTVTPIPRSQTRNFLDTNTQGGHHYQSFSPHGGRFSSQDTNYRGNGRTRRASDARRSPR
jgi:hypothetical protein